MSSVCVLYDVPDLMMRVPSYNFICGVPYRIQCILWKILNDILITCNFWLPTLFSPWYFHATPLLQWRTKWDREKRFFSFDQLFILIGKSSITYFISGSKCISLRLLDIFHYIFSTLQLNPNNMFISSILK